MKISLCIVARNEEAFLRECIESARPVVDEIVVVDTGSTDRTPDIAAHAGALVVPLAWPGDLGRAHNLPLEYARADWVLALDADEVLDPRRRLQIRDLVDSGDADGYRLPIRNYSYEPTHKWRPADPSDPLTRGALGYLPTRPVRLFRRREEYRFTGHLHQAVAPSILQSGGHIGDAEVPIHHYGPLRADRSKSPFYVSLARREAAARPRYPRAWIELGVLLFRQDPRGALEAFRRARALGLRAAASFFAGWLLIDMKRPAAGIRLLREAIGGSRARESVDYDGADAWELLGRAYEMRGQSRSAEAAYRRAIALRPESPVAMNNLAGLLADRRATREARRLVDRLLRRYRGLDTVWAVLGTVRLGESDPEAARRAFEIALDINPLNATARAGLESIAGRRGPSRHGSSGHRADQRPEHAAGRPRGGTRGRACRMVITLAGRLGGGPGHALADAVRALRQWPQLVLCCRPRTEEEQQELAALESAGVEVRLGASAKSVRRVLEQLRPACVIVHWTDADMFLRRFRIRDERWIAVGHLPLPMPVGYDAYVVGSAFHDRFQGHVPPERRVRIPRGVDLRRFRRARRRPGSPVTIVMLDRLEPGRFPRRLLAYLPALRETGARLVIAGSGSRRFEIEADVAAQGLADVVRFVGPLPGDRIPEFLADADIGLHLTEVRDDIGGGRVPEMLAAGLPVIAEPKGCLPELIAPGKNGFLATGEREIADRLGDLVSSPALRHRMGLASRRTARRYDIRLFRSSLRGLVAGLIDGY
jgi:glycosyltransferase involved in cell wall biosynthesis/Tfp pilus assembly protein PilF